MATEQKSTPAHDTNEREIFSISMDGIFDVALPSPFPFRGLTLRNWGLPTTYLQVLHVAADAFRRLLSNLNLNFKLEAK